MVTLKPSHKALLDKVKGREQLGKWTFFNRPYGGAYYAMMDGAGRIEVSRGSLCYGSLRETMPHNRHGPVKAIMTSYPSYSEFEKADNMMMNKSTVRHYYDWLINRSPFRYAYEVKDVDYMMRVGNFHDPDLPANYLLASLIAGRFPWERPATFPAWATLVSLGMDENLAFLAANPVGYTETAVGSRSSASCHDAVAFHAMDGEDVRAFMMGVPGGKLTQPYSSDNSYNSVFGAFSLAYIAPFAATKRSGDEASKPLARKWVQGWKDLLIKKVGLPTLTPLSRNYKCTPAQFRLLMEYYKELVEESVFEGHYSKLAEVSNGHK